MLRLSIYFVTKQYLAAQEHSPNEPEYPPHPSRVFSALVAAASNSFAGLDDPTRKALTWLAHCKPPQIQAPDAFRAKAPISYVPVADINNNEKKAQHPVTRMKQPRAFPTACLLTDVPEVHFIWTEEPEEHTYQKLNDIVKQLHQLGTSHSLICASLHAECSSSDVPYTQMIDYVPSIQGEHHFRVALPGRLEELELLHQRKEPGVRRPPPRCEPYVSYKRIDISETSGPFIQLIPLRIEQGLLTLETLPQATRALRKAVMDCMKESGIPVPPAVHGHHVESTHVAWLPLPHLHHMYADGRCLGIGVAIPNNLSDEQQQQLLLVLGQLCNRPIRLTPSSSFTVSPVSAFSSTLPAALKPNTWVQASKRWRTITPIILDRFPKKNKGESFTSAITNSLIRAGYPKPTSITLSKFSPLKGALNKTNSKVPSFHVSLEFSQPLRGPVIAGRGRYFGLGMLVPERS